MTLMPCLRLAGMAALMSLAVVGCGRKTGPLQPWPLITDPIVFQDTFTGAVEFQAFAGSKLDALGTDTSEQYDGSGCLKITVPNPGGGYAGGAFVASEERNLSGNDALTFYAKASRAVPLEVAGLGNDNTGTSKFEAKWSGIPLTTTWKKYVIPIPLPEKLGAERGLFFFAGGPQGGAGFTMWLDEVKFEKLGTISNPRPALTALTLNSVVGATVPITGTRVTFSVEGTDRLVEHSPAYFTYASSDPGVATVADAVIRVVGEGTATITARLGAVDATGAITVNATAPPAAPAPSPTVPAGDVLSLFSNAYANVTVDTWSAGWDLADVADLEIGGDDVKLYTNLTYAGIEFATQPIDASTMTHFHMDLWVPTGSLFKVKLVDFGANGVFGGGDDREHELSFNASSIPPLATGAWVGLEIPLTDFINLTTRAHLAQLIISGDTRTVYADNIYFHR